MACEREARKRNKGITFWISAEEKAVVDSNILLSGLPKGDYYRQAVLNQKVAVKGGAYMSHRLANVLEAILQEIQEGDRENEQLLQELLLRLLEIQNVEK